MTDTEQGVHEPKQDRIGNDFREGPNPDPGGVIDTGDTLVPPYEDRAGGASGPESDMTTEAESQEARAESVRRQQSGEDAPQEANPESLVGPTGGSPGEMPPEGVGESVARRGEDMIKHEGKEAGRHDTGTDGSQAGRPTGGSTPRDGAGVDPQEGPNT
jgi:hypothetical protein